MDFQKLSELSGVEPTRIEKKGENRISWSGRVLPVICKENAFEFHLPESHGHYVNRLYNKLMRSIKNPKQLGVYCKSHGIKVLIVVVLDGITDTYSFPYIHQDKKFIRFLADLNAEVAYDVYTEPWSDEDDDYKTPAIVLPSGECLYKVNLSKLKAASPQSSEDPEETHPEDN